ncbi:MAG: hypothetical protein J3Q66DRAFT_401821 [Benniella sp.]|nr:MAG: hypothetical protein J3Q66DRAFT_401821 [Benniella sp.]
MKTRVNTHGQAPDPFESSALVPAATQSTAIPSQLFVCDRATQSQVQRDPRDTDENHSKVFKTKPWQLSTTSRKSRQFNLDVVGGFTWGPSRHTEISCFLHGNARLLPERFVTLCDTVWRFSSELETGRMRSCSLDKGRRRSYASIPKSVSEVPIALAKSYPKKYLSSGTKERGGLLHSVVETIDEATLGTPYSLEWANRLASGSRVLFSTENDNTIRKYRFSYPKRASPCTRVDEYGRFEYQRLIELNDLSRTLLKSGTQVIYRAASMLPVTGF